MLQMLKHFELRVWNCRFEGRKMGIFNIVKKEKTSLTKFTEKDSKIPVIVTGTTEEGSIKVKICPISRLCPKCNAKLLYGEPKYQIQSNKEDSINLLFNRVECPNCNWKGYQVRYRPFDQKSWLFIEHEENNVKNFSSDGRTILHMYLPVVKKCIKCGTKFKLEEKNRRGNDNIVVYGIKCNRCRWTGQLIYDDKSWMITNLSEEDYKKHYGSQKRR